MKVGKTTLASQFPDPVLLAFEVGYNAIPKVIPQDVTSWSEMRAVLRDLKKPAVKERFKTVIIDTIDIAGSLCEKYICAQNSVEKIAEVPYGGGYSQMKREFEETCRAITQLGYALVFISHDKERTVKINGEEILQIGPSCQSSFNDIAKNAADIYGYAQKYKGEDGTPKVRLVLRSQDGTIDTGCRFKYIPPVIDFTYSALVDAVNEAIDKEAKMNDNKFVTDERNIAVKAEVLNYDGLIADFNGIVSTLMQKDKEYYGPRITAIVNKILGKGKKVSDSTPEQVELIKTIVDEIKDEYLSD